MNNEQATPFTRLMWISPERVLYVGLLGQAAQRCLGAYTLYVALGEANRISIAGGAWSDAPLAFVPPYVPHRVVSGGRLICKVMVEAETVARNGLPSVLLGAGGAVDAPEVAQRVRASYTRLLSLGHDAHLSTQDFDQAVFGRTLPARAPDSRIAAVLAGIRQNPAGTTSAQEMAHAAGLSFSRFLHLFKQETGAPYRQLRAWKRARGVLHHVTGQASLTEVALDAGYPDSTHFSHSVRRYYGIRPRDMFAGSRRLQLLRPRENEPRSSP